MTRVLLIAIAIVVLLSTACFAQDAAKPAGPAPLFNAAEPVPADAIVLFDGKDLSAFHARGSDGPATWIVKDGYCTPEGPDILSKQLFTDCQLHVEFWVPFLPNNHGQERGNSGVFFKEFCYEIQILDSYGLKSSDVDCGAIYSRTPPMVNACRPPETWQTYDMIFHSPKFDADGKKIANARITVFQNGVMIHDNAEIAGPTPDHNAADPKGPGPIELQDHGYPVRFRNVWVRPL